MREGLEGHGYRVSHVAEDLTKLVAGPIQPAYRGEVKLAINSDPIIECYRHAA